MIRRPPRSALFPYTPLSRSNDEADERRRDVANGEPVIDDGERNERADDRQERHAEDDRGGAFVAAPQRDGADRGEEEEERDRQVAAFDSPRRDRQCAGDAREDGLVEV